MRARSCLRSVGEVPDDRAAASKSTPTTLAVSRVRRSSADSVSHLAGRRGRAVHAPAAVELADRPRLHEVVEDVDHEERVAPAALEDVIRRVLGERATETSRRVHLHVVSRQELEVEMFAETPSLELANGLAQSRGAHDRVGRTIGADDQKPRGFGTLGDRDQQLHRGHVAPMEVLQHQHQGRPSCQALERVVELTYHPFPRGALDPALQPLELRALDRGGQLHEPHGRAVIEKPG
jgi:hypothetical protein